MVASTQAVHEMLVQLAKMLKALEAHPLVRFIHAHGTLAPVPASWHHEMHPSKGGFNRIAEKFAAKVKALFPGTVIP